MSTWRPLLPASSTERALIFAADWRPRLERAMAARLESQEGPPALVKAVRLAIASGGKRFRPLLFLATAEAVEADPEEALPLAPWVEYFHAFTLVQDDLPALDDDDERRGLPAVHIAAGEATAILASDSLLGMSLCTALEHGGSAAAAIAADLARLLLPDSLVGGQEMDLALDRGEHVAGGRAAVNRQKTAALFAHTCRAAALWAAAPDPEAWAAWGEDLGMLFQATDDRHDLPAGHPDLAAREEVANRHGAAARAGLAALGGAPDSTLAAFVAWAGSW